MKTILVPTDFSGNAAAALNYAVGLAQATGSRIVLAHTVYLPSAAMIPEFDLPSLITSTVAEANRQLHQMAFELHASTNLAVDTACEVGPMVERLNLLVEQQAVDLVVMGSHGQSGLADRLMGTNATDYLKRAHCPVLVVPPTATFAGLAHLAFAYDLESECTDFLRQLFQLSALFQARVTIFNVKSERQLDIVSDETLLRRLQKHFPEEEYALVQIKENDVVQGILGFVRDHAVSVLAVSIQKRFFVEELLHTSISKKLVFETKVPILAIQEKSTR